MIHVILFFTGGINGRAHLSNPLRFDCAVDFYFDCCCCCLIGFDGVVACCFDWVCSVDTRVYRRDCGTERTSTKADNHGNRKKEKLNPLSEPELMKQSEGFPPSTLKLLLHEAQYTLAHNNTQFGEGVTFHERIIISPVLPDPPTSQLEDRWVKWLKKFPVGSVVYCSFEILERENDGQRSEGQRGSREEGGGWVGGKESACKAVKLVMDEESEIGREVRKNHIKFREILLSEGLESSYIDSFIPKLQDLVDN
ncbi:hypothetical protein GIB67_020542 [Kingdonia uniflora]|uniref:Uncharacterized protein n=1 Tax=Kingdonia uniflora TaxID=39325 RepID=A0A7J7NLZ1_9MAGN|nr:hypothetical protein GIB67_020542 [Kingdonia uniflora]